MDYTSDANMACTGFGSRVKRSHFTDEMEISLENRVRIYTSPAGKRKVTRVALLRKTTCLKNVSEIPALHGTYNGMTGDINRDRAHGLLYLVWKTVVVG